MALLAQVFLIGPIEHDLLQVIGLLVATFLLGAFAYLYLRSETAKRPRLVSMLVLVAIGTTVWTLIESGMRLGHALIEQWNRNS